jgi:hypothetical protein
MYPGIVFVNKQDPDAIESKLKALKSVANFKFLLIHSNFFDVHLKVCRTEFLPVDLFFGCLLLQERSQCDIIQPSQAIGSDKSHWQMGKFIISHIF